MPNGTPEIDWDAAADVVDEPVTTPVTPKPLAFDAERRIREALAEDPPVSDSKEPIKLADVVAPKLASLAFGDHDIVASLDKIEIIRRAQEAPAAPRPEPPPMPERILTKIEAEMAAGRAALSNHRLRAELFPPPVRTQKEIELQHGKNTPVFRPGEHPLASLLNKPVEPGKGGGM